MQFILTLLISVRGRKPLKDGSDLSFSGKEAGLTDKHRRSREARPGRAHGPVFWLGACWML